MHFPRLFPLLALFVLAGLLASCNKDEDDMISEPVLSEEQASDVLEGAITVNSQGLGAGILGATFLANKYAEKGGGGSPCDMAFDSTLAFSVGLNQFSASYTTSWNWAVNCNDNNIPVSINYSRTASGQYETPRIKSDDSASSEWMITGLLLGDDYTLNGAYQRQGSQEIMVNETNTFSSLTTFEIEELKIDKGTFLIQSGTGTYRLTATGPQGNITNFEGDLTFNGGGSVTVTINGNSYTFSLF